jgi:ribonuclease/clavin/mitogillin
MWTCLPGLVGLEAGNPGPMTGAAGNQTWLLTGAVPTLVDAGVGADTHLDALAAALAAVDQPLAQVIVTHAHPDHASGVVRIAARWPAVRFRKWPWPEADARYAVAWTPLGADEVVDAGDVQLRVIHTPGHSPDHVCLWHDASRTVFGGDLLIEDSTVVVPGTRGGDLAAYLASLARVASLGPAIVLPAHGPVIEDPASLIERYSAHRMAREREVLSAVLGGATSVEAIVHVVYPTLAEAMRPVAVETVHAHLNKLRDEGRVADAGGCLQVIF